MLVWWIRQVNDLVVGWFNLASKIPSFKAPSIDPSFTSAHHHPILYPNIGAWIVKSRQLALAVAILAAGSLTGGLLGPRLDAAADRSNDRLKTFSEILGIIQDQYVEEVSPEVAIEGAIDGMLKTLDPHTHYLNTSEYQD